MMCYASTACELARAVVFIWGGTIGVGLLYLWIHDLASRWGKRP